MRFTARVIRPLRPRISSAISTSLAFGVAVYFFMKDVVVAHSAARPIRFTWTAMIGHALLVGLPIALVAARHHRQASPSLERPV